VKTASFSVSVNSFAKIRETKMAVAPCVHEGEKAMMESVCIQGDLGMEVKMVFAQEKKGGFDMDLEVEKR
jgi:uncharacterized OB-fold protein